MQEEHRQERSRNADIIRDQSPLPAEPKVDEESFQPGTRLTKVLGPRYPDPEPIRSDYAHLSRKEWLRVIQKWRGSTPKYREARKRYEQANKAKLDVYRAKYRKLARVKECTKRYRSKLKTARVELLKQISIDGHCCYKDSATGEFTCRFPAELCDVDHLDANTILPDGLRRKQTSFGCALSRGVFNREIERNRAEDGTLLLQALCPYHHALKDPRDPTKKLGRQERDRLLAVNDVKMRISRCQYEACDTPEVVCDSHLVARGFHFDHLFTAREDAPEGREKVLEVSQMIQRVHEYSLEDILAEITKCRLVHANCHRKISMAQHATGRLKRRPAKKQRT
jgi:hypothetical protein